MQIRCEERSPDEGLIQQIALAHQTGELWASSWSFQAVLEESKAARTIVASVSSANAKAEMNVDRSEDVGLICFREPGMVWEITLVFVSPPFRGLGVLDRLMGALRGAALSNIDRSRLGRDRLPQSDSNRISLEVRADNRAALKAYRRMGFREILQRKRYYRDQCDAVVMELEIS